MKNIWALLFILLVGGTSCSSGGNTTANPVKISSDGFEIQDVPGSTLKRWVKKNAANVVEVEGFMKDSLQHGTWVEFHPDSNFPAKVTSFIDGKANGPNFEFNERGQVKLQAHYKNNTLDGYWAKYRFGRPTNEAGYVDGKLHGGVKEYDLSTGDLQKEMYYNMGVMDGPYRFYNDGEVTIEYFYKNGKRIGGNTKGPSAEDTQ